MAFISATQNSAKTTAARVVASASVTKKDLETSLQKERDIIWASLVKVIAAVVSKAVLDLNEEIKKPKVDKGGLILKVTSNSVRAIKECGLLHPSGSIEVAEVQKEVWKDVFPQTAFPYPSQADSTPHSSMASQTK